MWCGISRIFILCSCSGCIQKHYRIVYLGRAFVPNGLMASFKVIGVDIPSDGFSCFLEISILREICFLILEAAEPAFNHDIICPSAFAIHALTDSAITNKIDVFVTGKLASSFLKFFPIFFFKFFIINLITLCVWHFFNQHNLLRNSMSRQMCPCKF